MQYAEGLTKSWNDGADGTERRLRGRKAMVMQILNRLLKRLFVRAARRMPIIAENNKASATRPLRNPAPCRTAFCG